MTEICRAFLQNRCRFGDRCRYRHVTQTSLLNAPKWILSYNSEVDLTVMSSDEARYILTMGIPGAEDMFDNLWIENYRSIVGKLEEYSQRGEMEPLEENPVDPRERPDVFMVPINTARVESEICKILGTLGNRNEQRNSETDNRRDTFKKYENTGSNYNPQNFENRRFSDRSYNDRDVNRGQGDRGFSRTRDNYPSNRYDNRGQGRYSDNNSSYRRDDRYSNRQYGNRGQDRYSKDGGSYHNTGYDNRNNSRYDNKPYNQGYDTQRYSRLSENDRSRFGKEGTYFKPRDTYGQRPRNDYNGYFAQNRTRDVSNFDNRTDSGRSTFFNKHGDNEKDKKRTDENQSDDEYKHRNVPYTYK